MKVSLDYFFPLIIVTNCSALSLADVSRNLPSMEEIVQDDMVCLLCLQVPKEWFVIRACGCKFCLQVIFNMVN